MKRCPVCDTIKEPEAFSVKRSTKDGRNPYCKKCEVARVKAFAASRPEFAAKKAEYDRARNIEKAAEIKAKARARYVRDSKKRTMAAGEWAKANPVARRAIANAYKHRRRAQCETGMTGGDLREWLGEQVMICSYCGCDCSSTAEVDHIVPLSARGTNTVENLTISCPPCNRRKSSKTLLMFLLDRLAA